MYILTGDDSVDLHRTAGLLILCCQIRRIEQGDRIETIVLSWKPL